MVPRKLAHLTQMGAIQFCLLGIHSQSQSLSLPANRAAVPGTGRPLFRMNGINSSKSIRKTIFFFLLVTIYAAVKIAVNTAWVRRMTLALFSEPWLHNRVILHSNASHTSLWWSPCRVSEDFQLLRRLLPETLHFPVFKRYARGSRWMISYYEPLNSYRASVHYGWICWHMCACNCYNCQVRRGQK